MRRRFRRRRARRPWSSLFAICAAPALGVLLAAYAAAYLMSAAVPLTGVLVPTCGDPPWAGRWTVSLHPGPGFPSPAAAVVEASPAGRFAFRGAPAGAYDGLSTLAVARSSSALPAAVRRVDLSLFSRRHEIVRTSTCGGVEASATADVVFSDPLDPVPGWLGARGDVRDFPRGVVPR